MDVFEARSCFERSQVFVFCVLFVGGAASIYLRLIVFKGATDQIRHFGNIDNACFCALKRLDLKCGDDEIQRSRSKQKRLGNGKQHIIFYVKQRAFCWWAAQFRGGCCICVIAFYFRVSKFTG